MIPLDHLQGKIALTVAIISAVSIWFVIWLGLRSENRFQSNNTDEH